MKKIRVIQIIELIILIIIAVGLISFLSSVSKDSLEARGPENFKSSFKDSAKDSLKNGFRSSTNFRFWSRSEKNLIVLKEEDINSSGIEKIKIDAGSADINIVVTDDAVIKVIESAHRDLREEELFTLSNQEGVLTIARGKSIPTFMFWGAQHHKIEVFIPKSYIGDLDLNATSGDTEFLSELKLKSLHIRQSSGNVESKYPIEVQRFSSHLSSGDTRLDYLVCSEYEIDTSSGNSTINRLKGSGSIESTSGNIKVRELFGGNYSIKASSGNITIDTLKGSGSIESTSGNIKGRELFGGNYSIKASSGNITIDMLKGSGSIESTSGNIKVRELFGGNYSIKASSGNIELQNVTGSGEVTTTSGYINIDYNEIEEYSKLKASSGNLRIKLAEQISFQMNAKCSSGKIRGSIDMDYTSEKRNEAEAVVGNEPYAKLTLNTSSGDITID